MASQNRIKWRTEPSKDSAEYLAWMEVKPYTGKIMFREFEKGKSPKETEKESEVEESEVRNRN